MLEKGQRYTQEFKESAIQLALGSEKSTLQIARELGMSEKTLYGWLRRYRNEQETITMDSGKKVSLQSIEEENKRLRKELATLKKEKEILKKAAAYFAKETA